MSSELIRRRLDVLGARKLYIAAAAASAGLIAAALFMQHVVGLNPCPLCILQRVAYLLLALAAALAAWRSPRPSGGGFGVAALIMALIGAGPGRPGAAAGREPGAGRCQAERVGQPAH